jgi:hypothetical protein
MSNIQLDGPSCHERRESREPVKAYVSVTQLLYLSILDIPSLRECFATRIFHVEPSQILLR